MSITQSIRGIINIPVEGASTFRLHASAIWAQLNGVSSDINSFKDQINALAEQLKAYYQNVLLNASDASLSKIEAKASEDNAKVSELAAKASADEIKKYVVPAAATYSPIAIEEKLDMEFILNTTGAI